MKVLTIGTTDILGGAAKVSQDIRTALKNDGHSDPMFVASKRGNDPDVKIIPRHYWQKVLGLLLATDNFITTDWLLGTTEFKEADLIHCHNLHGRYFNLQTLQKMSMQKPVVWTLHDEWAITPHCAYTLEGTNMKNGFFTCPSLNTQPRLLWDNTNKITRERTSLYNNSKLTIVAPSLWLHNRVKRTPLAAQNLTHIINGVDTDTFTQTNKTTAREKLNLPRDKKIILFLATAGKANTWKGWVHTESVIEKLKNEPDLLFLNVGGLSEEISTAKNVVYRKHVSNQDELALYYSAADLLLFTSLADNFPLVILEAMSCGLPIVSFNVGGVPEVLTHKENGYVAKYCDNTELLNGIDWVLQLSREERSKLEKRSSLKIRQHYTTKDMTDSYLALFKKLVAK